MPKQKIVEKEKIIERWSALLDGANGRGEAVMAGAVAALQKLAPPDIHLSKQECVPSGGIVKGVRTLLVAEHKKFDTLDMYIGVRDYGNQLFVSWYLVDEPRTYSRMSKRDPVGACLFAPFYMLAAIIGHKGPTTADLLSTFNLFDTEEVTAYVTTVHHALLASVKAMMEDAKLDFTKVDSKTRGFLNVS